MSQRVINNSKYYMYTWFCFCFFFCRLRDCGITHEGCAALALAIRSNPSHLNELDLSGNKLKNFGVKKLSAELENSDCNLEMLRQDQHSPLLSNKFCVGTEMTSVSFSQQVKQL